MAKEGIPKQGRVTPQGAVFPAGVVMQTMDNLQLDFRTSLIPEEMWTLPGELGEVDQILDDPAVLAPLASVLSPTKGRPSLAVAQMLRLFYLKERYQMSDRVLIEEVADSFHWRRFCRFGVGETLPHPTSLTVWRHRLGERGVQAVNEAVVARLRQEKVVRGKKFRMDSTVVEANIHYPTDANLLSDGMRVITRVARKIHGILRDKVERVGDRSRAVQRRLLAITKHLQRRTGEAYGEVRAITESLARLAETGMAEVRRVVEATRKVAVTLAPSTASRVQRQVIALERTMEHLERVVEQSRQVTAGDRHLPERIVSLADPDARPIVKGKLGQKVQFGYKVQIAEAEGGFVTDYTVEKGNPPDVAALVPALNRHRRRFGGYPLVVTTDRGYDSRVNREFCEERLVRTVAIPKRGKITAARRAEEQRAAFRQAQGWRAGGEATVSRLKRKYGLRRSRYWGRDRVAAGVGLGIFTHNVRRWALART